MSALLDIVGFVVLLGTSLAFVRNRDAGWRRPLLAALGISSLAVFAYLQLGAWREVQVHRVQLEIMASGASDTEARARLRHLLQDMTDKPEYAYLLGHTLLADEEFEAARRVFLDLREQGVEDAEVDLAFVRSDFLARDGVFGEDERHLAGSLLDSEDPILLEMLVLDALRRQDQQAFMSLWPQYAATPRGAAFAQELGQGAGTAGGVAQGVTQAESPQSATVVEQSVEAVRIGIAVSASRDIESTPDTPVFVLVRDLDRARPPLAVKRLRFADLPVRLSLSDADAMLESNRLSSARRVEVLARIAFSGDAVPAEGDIEVSSGAIELSGNAIETELHLRAD